MQRVLAPHLFLTRRNVYFICSGYASFWLAPPPNGSSTTTYQLLNVWRMAFLSIWVHSCLENSIEPCFCWVLNPNSLMVGPFGWFKCGPTLTFPQLLLSFILLSCHGLMEKPGCMPGSLRKKESPPSLHVSNFSMIHPGGGRLKSSCLLRQRSMVLRISESSRAKASSEETRHGVLVQLLLLPLTWAKNTNWMARVIISKDEAKQISVSAREQITSFVFTPFSTQLLSSFLFHNWWEAYMANFNNEDNLIEALQGCCPEFLTYQLLGTFLLLFSFCLCCLFCLKHYVNLIFFFQMLVSSM